MDNEEKHFSKVCKAYLSGFNRTGGGQDIGQVVALLQSQTKTPNETWTEDYMPLLRKLDYALAQRLWETPQTHVVEEVWPVGQFLHNLRTGNRMNPRMYKAELRSFGFDKDKSVYE
jgi:hypothetical protein